MPPFRRLLSLLRPYSLPLTIAVALMGLVGLLTSVYVFLAGPLLKALFWSGQGAKQAITVALPWVGSLSLPAAKAALVLPALLLITGVARGAGNFAQAAFTGLVSQKLSLELRRRTFNHLTVLPVRTLEDRGSGDLVARMVSDIPRVEYAAGPFVASLMRASMQLIALTGAALWLEPRLTLLAAVVAPAWLALAVGLGRRLKTASRAVQDRVGRLTAMTQEVVRGARIVKAFQMERYEQGRFDETVCGLYRSSRTAMLLRACSSPVMEALGAAAIAVVFGYAYSRLSEGEMSPEALVGFLTALVLIYRPASTLADLKVSIQPALASVERLFEVLDAAPEETASTRAVQSGGSLGGGDEEPSWLPPAGVSAAEGGGDRGEQAPAAVTRGGVEFIEVEFSYGEGPVLDRISFRVDKGEAVTLVGPSGGGKSTISALLARFFEAQGGQILIDGVDTRRMPLEDLRSRIGLVTQRPVLFNDTIRANILYGREDVTEERLREVAEMANATEFIGRLPEGFETVVGEDGLRLSGGQAQRLAIARALLKDPPILVLDEATSHLDPESERKVRSALEVLVENRTTLVVAHRPSTVERSERVLVVVDGRVVEDGSPEELLTRGGEYARQYREPRRDPDGEQRST